MTMSLSKRNATGRYRPYRFLINIFNIKYLFYKLLMQEWKKHD